MTEPKDTLTEKIIGLAMKVHSSLGPGFVEFVYRNALIHEFRKNGIKVESEKSLKVVYDGAVVGDFKADLFLDEWLLCELKAVRNLLPEHEVQLVNYLAALNLDFGLLLNFGVASRIYEQRRPGGYRAMPDGRGGTKEYFHQPQHDLAISRTNLIAFANEIGFITEAKQGRLANYLSRLTREIGRAHV